VNERRRGSDDGVPGHAARPLQDLVATEAPLPARRAAAVLLSVARGMRSEQLHGRDPGPLRSADVILHDDGSVDLRPSGTTDPDPPDPDRPGPAGASLGRLLFELLVGRPPLDRADALEPAITDTLEPADCALVARSCSEAPGQWPSVDEWVDALTRIAGSQAPPPAPAERARQRRRIRLIGAGLAALALASVLSLVLTPVWWRGADEQRPDTTTSSTTQGEGADGAAPATSASSTTTADVGSATTGGGTADVAD